MYSAHFLGPGVSVRGLVVDSRYYYLAFDKEIGSD